MIFYFFSLFVNPFQHTPTHTNNTPTSQHIARLRKVCDVASSGSPLCGFEITLSHSSVNSVLLPRLLGSKLKWSSLQQQQQQQQQRPPHFEDSATYLVNPITENVIFTPLLPSLSQSLPSFTSLQTTAHYAWSEEVVLPLVRHGGFVALTNDYIYVLAAAPVRAENHVNFGGDRASVTNSTSNPFDDDYEIDNDEAAATEREREQSTPNGRPTTTPLNSVPHLTFKVNEVVATAMRTDGLKDWGLEIYFRDEENNVVDSDGDEDDDDDDVGNNDEDGDTPNLKLLPCSPKTLYLSFPTGGRKRRDAFLSSLERARGKGPIQR